MPSAVSLRRLAGACGIITPVVAFSCIGTALALSPWFSWAENALSDLGAAGPPVAPIFNDGLIMAGLLAVIFSLGLCQWTRKSLPEATGSLLILVSSACLAPIGAFPVGSEPIFAHTASAVGFFIISMLGRLILGASGLARAGKGGALRRPLAALVLASGLLDLAVWVWWALTRPELGLAVPEIIAASSISTCLIALGLEILRHPQVA